MAEAEAGAGARRSGVVIVPALDEASTIASVIRVARRAGVGPVLVVDDGSTDTTGVIAERAGAEVLRLPQNRGKGGAVAAGAESRHEDVVVLLDADLVGLRAEHVRALARPVLRGEVDMTRGVFTRGRWSTTAAQKMVPQLNGQRALLRDALLSVPGLAESRYGIEVAITDHAKEAQWRCLDVALPGVSQVMKEEKLGLLRGAMVRVRMYLEIARQVFRPQRNTPRR